MEADQDRTLDQWVARLKETLADRVVDGGPDPDFLVQFNLRIENSWTRDYAGDGKIPATFFLGRARRAGSDDPTVDMTICILEAAFRQDVNTQSLLLEGEAHPNKVVQWTAMHLVRDRESRKNNNNGPKKGPKAKGKRKGKKEGKREVEGQSDR